MPLPVEVQAPLLVKILSFDQSGPGGTGDPRVVAVVYQGRNRVSAEVARDMGTRLEATGSIRTLLIDLDRTPDLGDALARIKASALYIAPLRAIKVDDLAAASRDGQVVSLTGVPGYVDQGLAVGLELSAGRPQVVINLGASRAQGARFSAQLLKLARVVDRQESGP
jgi:hypothetical protein